jgi:predicted secreted protein
MNIATGIATFVVIWWLVLFMVLPFGAQPPEHPEPGHATSAPAKPRLLLKFAITTVVAAVIFAGVFWLSQSDLISFRE